MKWDDIQVFLAAFHAGSTAGAARELGLNQSTVSRRLTGLEAELGFRLFDRIPGGLVPTTSALDALASAEAMRSAAHRLTAVVYRSGSALVSRGEAFAELPPTVERLLSTQLSSSARRTALASPLARAEIELDGPVAGGARLRLRVGRKEGVRSGRDRGGSNE